MTQRDGERRARQAPMSIGTATLVRRAAALFCAALLLLLAQPRGRAQLLTPSSLTPGSLKFARNYFLTGGDVVVAGQGVRGTGDPNTGLATATITLGGVPEDTGALDDKHPDIAAAFVYWASIEGSDTPLLELNPPPVRPTFKSQSDTVDHTLYPKQIAPATVRGCWGSGGGGGTTTQAQHLRVYFEDVLQYLPTITDANGITKVKANGTYVIKVPDSGGGGTQSPSSQNQLGYTEGVSLVVVYRIPKATTLRAVVFYEGGLTMDSASPVMDLTMAGWYGAVGNDPSAKMIHIVADGDNKQERLTIGGVQVDGTNPFGGALGSAWDNLVAPLSLSGGALTVNTHVDPVLSSVDCLSWPAVIVSTAVLDDDGDGVPNALEDGTVAADPNGNLLPNLPAMGGNKSHKDLYAEFSWMTTMGWPSPSTVGQHLHKPSDASLKMVAAALKNAPVGNPDGKTGINPHFDLGNNYQQAGADPTSADCRDPSKWTFGCAIVPFTDDPRDPSITKQKLARGGETIVETACTASATCNTLQTELGSTEQFKDHPGTVGWKRGYDYYRDAWVAADGTQLSDDQEVECDTAGNYHTSPTTTTPCVRHRFDPTRMDIFHNVLWAHALGLRLPCVKPDGTETGYGPDGTTCAAPNVVNPNLHTPPKSSGFGDKGGGDVLITLAAFGGANYNGADIVQAGTLLHEWAHNFDRNHSGTEPGVVPESNCKTNYISVANYLFQVHGIRMLDTSTTPPTPFLGVDLSGQVLNQLKEDGHLNDAPLTTSSGAAAQYPTRWYAPEATSFAESGLNTTPAAKHCDGSLKNTGIGGDPDMVRVEGLTTGAIDWLNDGDTTDVNLTQDINFNGGPNSGRPADSPFNGSDDWTYIKNYGLRQVASRPNMGELSLELSLADLGRGDPGRGDPGRGDPGRGDPGRGDPGRGDPGRGDPGRGDPGASPGDLNFDDLPVHGPQLMTAKQVLKTVQLNWLAPYLIPDGVNVSNTWVYRVEGATLTPTNFGNRVLITQFGTTTPPPTSVVDPKPQNGRTYTYFVFVDYSNGNRSGIAISNPVSVKY